MVTKQDLVDSIAEYSKADRRFRCVVKSDEEYIQQLHDRSRKIGSIARWAVFGFLLSVLYVSSRLE